MTDARRRTRSSAILDAVAVGLLVGGGAYLLWGDGPVGDVAMPDLDVMLDEDGRPFVAIDEAALQDAFTRAGLPDPPDLDGADPVPVGILLELAGAWAQNADVESLGRLGQVFQALEEHRAALGCFVAAARRAPDDVRWWYGLGAECQAVGLAEEALEALDRARRLDPDYPTTYARLGALHLERGDLEAAAASYGEYRRRRPNESLAYVGLGRAALAWGRGAEAEELLRKAVDMTPNDFLAHRWLASALSANDKHEEARRAQAAAERLPRYTGWLTFDPRLQASHELADTQRYLTNELRVAAGAGEYQRFVRIAERLLQRRPADFSTLGNLAGVYRELGQLDKAQEAIDRALALSPAHAGLHCGRAEIAFTFDDYEATHDALDAAEALDPHSPRVFELRGRTYFLQGRHGQAIAATRRAVELDRGSLERRLLLATMQQVAGRHEEAAQTLRALLEMDPQNLQARQMLDSLDPSRP